MTETTTTTECKKYCKVCGARIDEDEYDSNDTDGSWYCTYCGAVIQSNDDTMTETAETETTEMKTIRTYPDEPVTGVANAGDPEWLHEDMIDAITPYRDAYLAQNPGDEYGDEYYADSETYYIGCIRLPDGDDYDYDIDPDADYSAIVSEPYVQVIKSKYVSRCYHCSPCFPNQGDLDTPGNDITYTLPPDVWGDADHLEIFKIEYIDDNDMEA